MKLAYKFGAVLVGVCMIIQPVFALETAAPEPVTGPVEEAAEAAPVESTDEITNETATEEPAAPVEEEATETPSEPETPVVPEPETPVVTEPSPEPEATTTPTELAPEATTTPAADIGPDAEFVPGQILVKFKESEIDLDRASGEVKAEEFAETNSLELTDSIDTANIAVLETEGDVLEEAKVLEDDPNVEYAEPNYIYRSTAYTGTDPSDTLWELQWALQNEGQALIDEDEYPEGFSVGVTDSDIDAQEAWELSTGTDVVVAVIDSGVDLTHPDLVNNLWDGTACVDENGDALGGCMHGYRFSTYGDDFEESDDSVDPSPMVSHGTHVAGIIAADADDGIGIAGVAPDSKIMAIRADTYFEEWDESFFVSEDLIRSIDFARENGAQVINASWGGGYSSTAMYEAIDRFGDAGGLFVAAAGNEGNYNDDWPSYPANYNLTNIISVAATDQNDEVPWWSNVGPTSVHVAAPGVGILSTVHEEEDDSCASGLYACYSGTSMAAPHVAGIAALLLAYDPTLTVSELHDAIVDTGDSLESLEDLVLSGKRVNAFNALASVATVPVTGTITLTGLVENDEGRTQVITDFYYGIDGGRGQLFTGETTVLTLAPGTYSIDGFTNEMYSAETDCTDIVIAVGTNAGCTITFRDNPDVTAPEIYLEGDNPQTVKKGRNYVELGATAYDETDGEVDVIIDATAVNTNVAGRYDVTYTAEDAAGNVAVEIREVIVRNSSGGGGGGGGGSKKKPPEAPKPVPAPMPGMPTPGIPVLPSLGYMFRTALGLGAQGADVLELQKVLMAKGYLVIPAPTGYYGYMTVAAVRQFQAANGILPTTGTAGPRTRGLLNMPPVVTN